MTTGVTDTSGPYSIASSVAGWTVVVLGGAAAATAPGAPAAARLVLGLGFGAGGLSLASRSWPFPRGTPGRTVQAAGGAVSAILGLWGLVPGMSAAALTAAFAGTWLSVGTFLSFLLLGVSALAASLNAGWSSWAAQTAAGCVLLGALMILLLDFYGYAGPGAAGSLADMPTVEALLFLVQACGCLLVTAWGGWMRAVSDRGLQGAVLRRLLPFSVGLPVVLGWVRFRMSRAGAVDEELGITLLVLSSILCLSVVAWLASTVVKSAETRRLASDARYRDTLDGLLEGCQVIGFDWRYRYVNEAAAAHGRRPRSELAGRTMMDCYPGIEGTPLFQELRGCMADRRPRRLENEFRYPDGATAWFHLAVDPVPEGIFILSLDVTERRRIEEERARQALQLEAEVGRRTRELEDANRELEAFSYTVSHDLRAPLRHMTGFADLLAADAEAGLDEKGKRYLRTIVSAGREMGVLIDRILDLSRIGRAELRTEQVDLAACFREAVSTLPPETTERGVRFDMDPLPVVRGDSRLLTLVLRNLLENAVKYTRIRAEPVVSLSWEQQGTMAAICVRDNGVGFDPRYADRLFGVFQRLHRPDEYEGTGIGLASVRRIVNRHGGRTWAEGRLGEGACFWFTLPAEAPNG